MRLKRVPAFVVVAMLGVISAAQAQTQEHRRSSRPTVDRHIASRHVPQNRVIVTHRSYLDPGPLPLPEERIQSRQYIFPLSMNQYNAGYHNPSDPTGSRFWPLSDPFWPYWP
jgi:hypothetical protein